MSEVQENAAEGKPLSLATRSMMAHGKVEKCGSENQITLGGRKAEWRWQ